MATKMWKALVEADMIVGGVPADSEEEAREKIERATDTGHLGPAVVKYVQTDEE